jgi:hypothetical protein
MEKQSTDIRNEFLSLEECLNLLFPSLNSRSANFAKLSSSRVSSIFQPAASPEVNNIVQEEDAESGVMPSPDEEESRHRPDSPPPKLPNSSLPGLRRDLQHLLSNHLKRARQSDTNAVMAQVASLEHDGTAPIPILCRMLSPTPLTTGSNR